MASQKALQHLNCALNAFGGVQQRDRGQQTDRDEDWEQNWIEDDGNSVMTPKTLWNMPFDHSITGQRTYHASRRTVGTYWIYVRRTDREGEHAWIKSSYNLRYSETLRRLSWSFFPWNSLNPNNATNKRFVLCTYTLRHNRTPHQTDVKEMNILHELPVAIQPSNAPRISAFRWKKLRRFITEATDEVKEKMSEKLREVYYWIPLGIPIADQIYLRDIQF